MVFSLVTASVFFLGGGRIYMPPPLIETNRPAVAATDIQYLFWKAVSHHFAVLAPCTSFS